MLLRGPSEKVSISRFVEWKSRKQDRLRDAEICNATRSEKRKASKKKMRKDLAVLAETPRLNRLF